jgi:Ca2+-transporting ATPase
LWPPEAVLTLLPLAVALLAALVITFIFQLAVVYLPFMQELFKTVALPPTALLLCLGLSTVVFWGVELENWFYRRR